MLTPDAIRYERGLKINEKLIPDTAVWNRDYQAGSYTYRKGNAYKANLKLSGGTGKVAGVTIHNTNRIAVAAGTTPAEQYTRATWPNCNMGTVRVHYYVDEAGAWQNLREDEVGWHAADGTYGPGNNTTIAIEIIMNSETDMPDVRSEENGALLTALLLRRYGLTTAQVYQHHDWYPKKDCPLYIRPHWAKFLQRVQTLLDAMATEESAAGDEFAELRWQYEKLNALYAAQQAAIRSAAKSLLVAAGDSPEGS